MTTKITLSSLENKNVNVSADFEDIEDMTDHNWDLLKAVYKSSLDTNGQAFSKERE
jgi:hypothetical protein